MQDFKVKRFNVGDGTASTVENKDGYWVKYSEALESTQINDDLHRENNALHNEIYDIIETKATYLKIAVWGAVCLGLSVLANIAQYAFTI